MTNIGDFGDRSVLIDAADTPLGTAAAVYLAARGARLALLGDDADRLASTVWRVGPDAVALSHPLIAGDDVMHVVSSSIAQVGGIDAGFSARGSVIDGLDDADDASAIRCLIDHDLTGTLLWTKALVEYFSVKKTGRIVTTAVAAGLFGLAGAASFSAVSAAISGMTKSYALALRGTDIRINAVAPILNKDAGGVFVDESTVLDVQQYNADVVAPVVGFLCSPQCQITGHMLSAAAGRVARTFCGTAAGFFDAEADHLDIEKGLAQILSIDHPVMLDDASDELLLIEV